MADEQGTGLPDGNFARKKTGKAVNGLLANVGTDGRRFPPRESEPSGPEAGDVYLADGTNWDPVGNGNAALVQYLNGAWQTIVEYTGVGGV